MTGPREHRGRAWRIGLAATLTLAMAVGTFGQFALGVLAPFIADEFVLSRTAIGTLTMTLFAVGAACSPLSGLLVDRWGARRVLVVLFASAAAALTLLGSAPSYLWLIAGAGLAGVALSAANPATNRLLARHVPEGQRGLVLGVKQSGVQFGALLAGLLLPVTAVAIGWRGGLAVAAVIPLLGMAGAMRLLPADAAPAPPAPAGPQPLPRGRLGWLAASGFFIGAGLAPVGAYLPLYAFERLGYGVAVAGLVGGAVGLAGTLGRVLWGWLAERLRSTASALVALGAGAALATTVVALAAVTTPALVWVGAGLLGLTAAAWMVVGMLAVLRDGGSERVGRSSAVVALAFHSGFVPSPALFGRVVDVTGSYHGAWAVVAVAFAGAALCALRLRARR